MNDLGSLFPGGKNDILDGVSTPEILDCVVSGAAEFWEVFGSIVRIGDCRAAGNGGVGGCPPVVETKKARGDTQREIATASVPPSIDWVRHRRRGWRRPLRHRLTGPHYAQWRGNTRIETRGGGSFGEAAWKGVAPRTGGRRVSPEGGKKGGERSRCPLETSAGVLAGDSLGYGKPNSTHKIRKWLRFYPHAYPQKSGSRQGPSESGNIAP